MASSDTRQIWRRVAEADDGAIFVDLGGSDRYGERRAVQITAEGWSIVEAASVPVMFVRPVDAAPFPEPVPAEAEWTDLKGIVNVDDHGAQLAWTWLVCAMRPFRRAGAYPVGIFHGEQGSGKSHPTDCLHPLVDPSISSARALPREERDLYVSARPRHLLRYGSVSSIGAVFSDAFCRIATGGTYSGRALHTDSDEVNLTSLRPILIDGIPSVASRPDLADRTITVQLHALIERRDDAELALDFERRRPGLLGLLFDGVASALRNLQTAKITADLRMRTAAIWAEAAAEGLGIESGLLEKAWSENREGADAIIVENDPLARAVVDWFAKRIPGTMILQDEPSVLFRQITDVAKDIHDTSSKWWPRNAGAMARQLRRLAPALRRTRHINFVSGKGGKDSSRSWTFADVKL